MHKYLTLAALLVAAPIAAQTPPPADHSKMQGMNHDAMAKPGASTPAVDHSKTQMTDHGKMEGMDHSKMQMTDHGKMEGMDHSKMGGMGEMMRNTPANPYAEVGMAMHHKMMVVGADASETWIRQMIEHHRGAIAMSKIAVSQAADKEVRAMAQKVVTMQEKEVASLQSWLKRNGKKAQ